MNKFLLACSGAFLLAAACAQSGPGGAPGSAGSSGGDATGSGGTGPGTGGTTGSGGTGNNTGSGGTDNAGVAGNGSGGSSEAGSGGNGSAGNTGSAGNGSAGSGNTGSGGSAGAVGNGGRGGTTGAGGTAGSAAGGRGGTTGAGGTAGSAAGGRGGAAGTTGGTGGSGTGGTGGSACPTIDQLIPGLDGYLWKVNPSGTTPLSGTNYPFGDPNGSSCTQTSTWATSGYIRTETPLMVKGVTGQKYTINIGVRGVVGTRCYTGGTPGSTAAGNPNGQNNTWYAGGAQYNNSIWNTMEIRVAPKVAGQANQTANSAYDIYFTNSFQNANSFCEKEATYETKFNASFPVTGGGSITFAVHDSNCRTLANCGSVEQQMTCNTAASRVIDMSGVSPAPTNFTQPLTGTANGATYMIQWEWIDVTSVTCN